MEWNIQAAIGELHAIFTKLNQAKFNGELPEPAILIQHSGGRKALGWCSVNEIWQNDEGSIKKREITVCAEHLARPVIEIAETMLHEMVHQYNAILGVKDCSRGGTYHNQKYEKEAVKRGLLVEKIPKYGWALTKLNPETETLIGTFSIDQDAFAASRAEESGKKAGKASLKYECACPTVVRCTKELQAHCEVCGAMFELKGDD